jgi:hypothetical protein
VKCQYSWEGVLRCTTLKAWKLACITHHSTVLLKVHPTYTPWPILTA